MCHCTQKQHFLRIIGKTCFCVILIKHSYFAQTHTSVNLTQEQALIQNRVLKCIYAMFNIIESLCSKVSIAIPKKVLHVNYYFGGPIKIPLRPQLITLISDKAITLLKLLRQSYYSRISKSPNLFLPKVHFYSYLLSKCCSLIQSVIQTGDSLCSL